MDRPLRSNAVFWFEAAKTGIAAPDSGFLPATPLILLHGFTGSPQSWTAVAGALARPRITVAVALPGHHPDVPVAAGFAGNVDRMAEILAGLDQGGRRAVPCHLVGYSLGARVALGLAARHPALIARLTLISVNPGLPDKAERARRRAADRRWIERLCEGGMEDFTRAWQAQPLFASQADHAAAVRAQHAIRMGHDPVALARSLEHMGLGVMPDYRAEAARLAMPVTLVSGALDPKFTMLAADLATRVPGAAHRVIAGCGHNPLLERPGELASLLDRADPA